MIKVKRIFMFIVTFLIIAIFIFNYKSIFNSVKKAIYDRSDPVIEESNKYTRQFNFLYVQRSDDYKPSSYQDVLNIYYSVLDNGWDKFSFYCERNYSDCINDVEKISNNETLLSNLNNFVSPYNQYSTIRTLYDSSGKVTIMVEHTYNYYDTLKIDEDIDKLLSELRGKDDYETIKNIHDYIINNTKYDTDRDNGNSKYDSARIQGVLYDHYAICTGYADIMGVFLDKMGLKNFRVSSDNHIWNAVYLNGIWYNLDLTWDDPVVVGGSDTLSYTYFMISTNELSKLKEHDHEFDMNVFEELKTT